MVTFSTKDVHPRDSMSYWMEIVAADFAKLSLTATTPFTATLRTGAIDRLSISIYDADPHNVKRGRDEISRADSDDYIICLQKSGKSIHHQGDREAIIEHGSFFLLDPRKPFSGALAEPGEMVAISVPRQELDARTGPSDLIVSRTITSEKPLSGLAFGFLTMLPERVDTIDEAAAPKVAEHTLDLVALAYSSEMERGPTLSSPRSAALTILKSTIESRLRDPDLRPVTAAEGAGISVRYANALLAQEGTGIEAYIISRRLERCRRAFDDPAQARRTIGDIAFSWGFSDLSHFGRRFKAAYGCTPGDYRRKRA
jgi:AraC family transcriptional regulator, positive regulator of tynA and feaB